MNWTPLTDEEFRIHRIPEDYRGFAYWDEEGYLITLHCHKAVLDSLKPIQPTTTNQHGQTQETRKEAHQADEGGV
jgi:hypothetical protein